MRIALIGTRGVPARYGGFETCVEEVGARLAARDHSVVVFCRGTDADELRSPGSVPGDQMTESGGTSYRGMDLVQLPMVQRRSLETLSHTALSVLHPALRGVHAAVVFNAANAPLLPALRARRIPVATHVDGLEWRRAKWGPVGRRYYRLAESLAVRWSDALIADAGGIADYYESEFGAPTRQIAYGAPILPEGRLERLPELNLEPHGYHLVVARFEPENHVLEIVRGYVGSRAARPLVVVGSAPYAERYTQEIDRAADSRVRFLGGVWDQDLLDELYAGALTYLHGHSVGGTNPSLLRAAGAGAFPILWDVNFNREVAGESGVYFRREDQLASALEQAEQDPAAARRRGADLREAVRRYNWDDVADQYAQLCVDLAARVTRLDRLSGRRRRLSHSSV